MMMGSGPVIGDAPRSATWIPIGWWWARTCTITDGHEHALIQRCTSIHYADKARTCTRSTLKMKIQAVSDLGALVRDRRGAQGLSQQALALRAGVSVRWLKAFEAG